jgi:predicted aspartyl protease
MYTQQFIIEGIDDYGPLVEAEIHTDEDTFLVQKNINQYQKFRKVKLLIDTGSSISGLDKRIINQLKLPVYSELAEIDGAGGVFNLKRHNCILYLKIFGTKGLPIDVIEGDYSNTIYDGIIGRDVLKFCFLEYDGPKEKYILKAIEF